MTAPYIARTRPLFGGAGAPPPPVQPLDIGGALEALAGGATSIIHQTMLRKQAQFERTRQQTLDAQNQDRWQQQIALQRQSESDRKAERAQDLARQDQKERREFLMAGGVPAHTEQQPTLDATPSSVAPITPLNPISQAMGVSQQRPDASAALGAPQITPSNAPASTGPGDRLNANVAPAAPAMSTSVYSPTVGSQTVAVPESYDPTRAAAYIRGTEMARLRDQGLTTRQQAKEEFTQEQHDRDASARAGAAKIAQDHATQLKQMELAAKRDPVTKAMLTGNQRVSQSRITADGIIAQFGGSYDQAEAWLNSNDPDAAKLRNNPPSGNLSWERLLQDAHGKYNERVTDQTLRLEGRAGTSPDRAAAKVTTTRRLTQPTPGAPPAVQPAAAAPKASITKAEHDALVKQGFTEAQITGKYTVTP